VLTIRNWPPEGGVINVGSGVFAESMQEQGANVYQVKWQPPAHGKAELIDILDELEGRSDIDKANQTAIERFSSAQPVLTGIGVAREAIPGFGDRMLLHAGPPITWGKMSGPLRGAVIGAILYEGWADSPHIFNCLHNAVNPTEVIKVRDSCRKYRIALCKLLQKHNIDLRYPGNAY
jgi:hypothetical protein